MGVAEVIFLSCLAIVLYVYVGYPLLLVAMSLIRRRPVCRAGATPPVSVIIPAHNEEQTIAAKLENTLALDYPQDRLEVIVASDGSTDATVRIVSGYAQPRLQLLCLPRCGKLLALTQAVACATGEIIAFTDANIVLEPSALRRLVARFADPEVGGVCSHKKPARRSAVEGEGFYWKFEQFVKMLESKAGSTIAADGAFYAIRKRLFRPISELAQADDFAISARVVLQGYRLAFEPTAVCYEEPPESSHSEFWRKVRVTNHSLKSILDLRQALKPWRAGFYAIELWSHKLLRYLLPFFLLAAGVANALLIHASSLYQLLLLGQALFYASALLGYGLRHHGLGRLKVFHLPFYFCLANLASCLGFLALVRGESVVYWQPRRQISKTVVKQ